MDVGPTLQFTQKLLNSMIGLWKQLEINIDYQPPQRLSFKTYFHKFSRFMTNNRFITCQPPISNSESTRKKIYDISYRFIHLFAKSSQDKIVTIKLHTK